MNKFLTILIICCVVTAQAATKNNRAIKPAPRAHSIMVVNQSTKQTLVSENAEDIRPMASITKLMTAMVVLDQHPSMDMEIVTARDRKGRVTGRATVKELLTRLLVRSDNAASEILSRNFLGSREEFLAEMNIKAARIGMPNTSFADPSGLDARNTTTAREIVVMVTAAGTYSEIRRAASLREAQIEVLVGRRVRTVSLLNTNHRILFEFDNIVVSKTGYTTPAGRCLALLVEQGGQQFAVVILGAPTPVARDQQARDLLYNHLVE